MTRIFPESTNLPPNFPPGYANAKLTHQILQHQNSGDTMYVLISLMVWGPPPTLGTIIGHRDQQTPRLTALQHELFWRLFSFFLESHFFLMQK